MLETLQKLPRAICPRYPLAVELEICDSVYRMFMTYNGEPFLSLDRFLEIIDEAPSRFEKAGIYHLNDTQDYNIYSSICTEYLRLLYLELADYVYSASVHSEPLTLKQLLQIKTFLNRVFGNTFIRSYRHRFNQQKWCKLLNFVNNQVDEKMTKAKKDVFMWKFNIFKTKKELAMILYI